MPKKKNEPSRTSIGAVRNAASEQAILDAAAGLLLENGYDDFSIESVAKRARAGKPTIYRWWGGKAQLIFDVYTKTIPVVAEAPDFGSVRKELAYFFERLWGIWSNSTNATISRRLVAAAQCNPESMAAYRDNYLSRRQAAIVSILKQGMARGELPEDLDIETVTDLLCGFNMMRLLTDKPVDSAAGQRVVDIILKGIQRRTRPQ